MNKKNYILIGVSLLLQLVNITVPFIGFGKSGICETTLPASMIVSTLLLMLALKGLYKETNIREFHTGFIMSIIGICILGLGTIISPLFSGGEFLGPYKYISLIFENQPNEDLLFLFTVRFFKSFRSQFIVMAIAAYFYAFGLFKFVNGLREINIDREHKNKLNKSVKTFAVVNLILFIISVLIFTIFIDFFKTIYFQSVASSIDNTTSAKLIMLFLVLYLVILPAAIVVSVFYYVNIVKSIICVFKAPSKYIQPESETIDLNPEN